MGIDSVGPINTNQAYGVKPQATSEEKSETTGIFGKLFSALTSIVKALFSPLLGVLALCKLGGDPYPPTVKKSETTNSNATGTNNSNTITSTAPFSRTENPPIGEKQATATPKTAGSIHIKDQKQNDRFFYCGDSQAGALHENNGGSQSTIHYNNNGRSQVGAGPKAILTDITNNIASLRGKTLVLSPGADNTNTDSTNTYKQMAALLRENNIPYIIIPPGNTNAKNQHLESLKTAFGAENILNTSSVSVSKIDHTHYNPRQLQQAIDNQYPTVA